MSRLENMGVDPSQSLPIIPEDGEESVQSEQDIDDDDAKFQGSSFRARAQSCAGYCDRKTLLLLESMSVSTGVSIRDNSKPGLSPISFEAEIKRISEKVGKESCSCACVTF
jgi:hypothetical protein